MSKDKDRAERMVDFGFAETKVTFDLGDDPPKEDVDKMREFLEQLKEEQ